MKQKHDPGDFYRGQCRHRSRQSFPPGCECGLTPAEVAHPIPCYSLSSNWGKCPQFAPFTETEIAGFVERDAQAARQYFTDLAANVCPHCKTPIAKTEKVGRCLYASPCGHRV